MPNPTIRIADLPNSVANPELRIPAELPGGQTVHVRLGDIMGTGGGGGGGVPRVELEVQRGTKQVTQDGSIVYTQPVIKVWFAGTYTDTPWLQQSPEIWLFRSRTPRYDKSRGGSLQGRRRKEGGWVHPTDHRWVTRHPTSKAFRGDTMFRFQDQGSGQDVQVNLQRVTEWACPSEPYLKAALEDFDLTRYFVLQHQPLDYGLLPVPYIKGGGDPATIMPMSRRRSARQVNKFSEYFHFRIVVKNPNYGTAGVGDDQAEFLYGPPSQTLRIAPLIFKQNGGPTVAGIRAQLL